MKKYCIGFIFLLLLGTIYSASAQSFTFELVSDSMVTGVPGTAVTVFAKIHNTSGADIQIDVIRLENDMPSGWMSAICLDVCYAYFVDSGRVYIYKDSVQLFQMHFYTSTASDSGHVKINFKNAGNPLEIFTQNFYAETDSMFLAVPKDARSFPIEIKLFPNPSSSLANIIIEDGYPKNEKMFLTLYDFTGRQIEKHLITSSEYTFSVENLPKGIYFYRFTTAEHIVSSGKLIKQ